MEIIKQIPRYNAKYLSLFRLQPLGNECRALVVTARGNNHSACVRCRGIDGDIVGNRRELHYLSAWTAPKDDLPHRRGRFDKAKIKRYGEEFDRRYANKSLGRLAMTNWEAGITPSPRKDSWKLLRDRAEKYGLFDPSFFRELKQIEEYVTHVPSEVRFSRTVHDVNWYELLLGAF